MCRRAVQADVARTFHSRLLPLRDAVDNIRTEALNSVRQQLTSVISYYRLYASPTHTSTTSWLTALTYRICIRHYVRSRML